MPPVIKLSGIVQHAHGEGTLTSHPGKPILSLPHCHVTLARSSLQPSYGCLQGRCSDRLGIDAMARLRQRGLQLADALEGKAGHELGALAARGPRPGLSLELLLTNLHPSINKASKLHTQYYLDFCEHQSCRATHRQSGSATAGRAHLQLVRHLFQVAGRGVRLTL